MKALVAGGAGFIGSHLIDALLAEGHDVVCVDNYFIGTKANIAHLQNNPHFKLYEQDLADFAAVNDIFRAEQVDYVFHLAANSDIQASANDPAIEYHNTYSTTFSLLEAMRLNGVKSCSSRPPPPFTASRWAARCRRMPWRCAPSPTTAAASWAPRPPSPPTPI